MVPTIRTDGATVAAKFLLDVIDTTGTTGTTGMTSWDNPRMSA
ncbi:hypothetical protein OK006_0907 [Actinobacteria bacterium OK006]|nr:hypothetical protein OK006_0907 [Actinobacteria bacterium OK006]